MVVPTMDNLPRVPDAHGDIIDEKLFSDLYIRTTWVDAQVALDQIDKGKAKGNRTAIYLRSIFQSHLQSLGCSVQKHAGKVLFVAILVLSTFCVGLKSAQIHSKVNQLWIQGNDELKGRTNSLDEPNVTAYIIEIVLSFPEGGRLEKELIYTQKSIGEVESSTHQLVIQTSHDPNASVLHPQALLTHLKVLKQAISVTIQKDDSTWSLRDICNIPTIPSFEEHFIEQIFDHIIPCSIMTPLDCFWEGSKLFEEDSPAHIPGLNERVKWTSLNPVRIVQLMKEKFKDQFPFDIVEQYMKRAAITTGYTEKPCLNTSDPLCPDTAPNKNSTQPPDVGAILTGGCYGYAAKYMHWPEELIVGGVVRNRTGHLKKAKGLQTVVQLMTEKELFDSWSDQYKVHHISWTQEKAAEILNEWQKAFSNKVKSLLSSSEYNAYDIFIFSSASLDDILEKFSNPSPKSIVIGVGVTVIYTYITLLRWGDPIRGQSSVGIAGVLLIGMSTAAGLGLCALLGIVFNAASTQVVPFLAMGLGVDHIFMLTAAYAESDSTEKIRNILMKVGPSILFSAATTAGSFFAAIFIPVPALKVFCIQAAVVVCFNLAATLFVFPAMISLDLRRRSAGRADILCCCFPIYKEKSNVNSTASCNRIGNNIPKESVNNTRQKENLLTGNESKRNPVSISRFTFKYYSKFLMNGTVKFFTIIIFGGAIIFSFLTSAQLQDGLDLIDLVPKDTNEYKFLNAQSTMFGFYNMFAVTQGNFEYPNNQKLIYEYHEAFVRVPHVIKNDNGGLPEFWLSLFRDWLINLQTIFDREYKDDRLNQEGWFKNASSDAILAYKLLVQTGYVDNPVDKSLITHNRLVNDDGIINPKAFYNYLSAWASNDVFAYGASQGKLRPEPRQWYHAPAEYDLKIPKSLPLVYTQLPFYLHGLTDTTGIKSLIGHIRDLSMKFEMKGLPNYPSGIPFIFWEQYMTLRSSLALILSACIFGAFVLVFILLLSLWAAILVVLNVLMSLIQIFGVMALLGMKLSAIPAVILILSVGLLVCITVNIALGFMTSLGSRERRVALALQISMGPLVHGLLTLTLAVLILSTSPFEFIVRHFFHLLLAVLGIGALNGLVLFPIILSLVGPEAELVPLEHENRISTPSPIPHRNRRANKTIIVNGRSSRCGKSSHSHSKNVNVNNEPSLTTITEEPQSWKSSSSSITSNFDKPQNHHQNHHHYQPSSSNSSNGGGGGGVELQSIVVQPEVTVETHQVGTDANTTKVTATANIKVELVTPGRARANYTYSS